MQQSELALGLGLAGRAESTDDVFDCFTAQEHLSLPQTRFQNEEVLCRRLRSISSVLSPGVCHGMS